MPLVALTESASVVLRKINRPWRSEIGRMSASDNWRARYLCFTISKKWSAS